MNEKITPKQQREYDALLLLHWRKDSRMMALATHVKDLLGEYPSELAKRGLLRANGFWLPTMYVRSWVGAWLYPLSNMLFDVSDNLKVLDWVTKQTKLDCAQSKRGKHYANERISQAKQSSLNAQSATISSVHIHSSNRRLDNPNQVKGKVSRRK